MKEETENKAKTEQTKNTIKTRAGNAAALGHTLDRKHLGRVTGTQTSLSWEQDESLLPGRLEVPFGGNLLVADN